MLPATGRWLGKTRRATASSTVIGTTEIRRDPLAGHLIRVRAATTLTP